MPTPTKGRRLGGSASHQKLMLANLSGSLFEHKRIITTENKAKRLRPFAESLITLAKKGDLSSRRRVTAMISNKSVVHELFTDIAETMSTREGGYTRITKLGHRKGDHAPMAAIELITEPLNKNKSQAKKQAPAPSPSVVTQEVVEEDSALQDENSEQETEDSNKPTE